MTVFQFIKASSFFPKYAPNIKNYPHKLRGTDGNGKPITWTSEDRKEIRAGLKMMIKDIIKSTYK